MISAHQGRCPTCGHDSTADVEAYRKWFESRSHLEDGCEIGVGRRAAAPSPAGGGVDLHPGDVEWLKAQRLPFKEPLAANQAIDRIATALSHPVSPVVGGLGSFSPEEAKIPTGEAERALANLNPAEFGKLREEARQWSGSAWLAGEKITIEERRRLQSEMYSWTCRLGNYFDWWAGMATAVTEERAPAVAPSGGAQNDSTEGQSGGAG